jgi:hypothetical protein
MEGLSPGNFVEKRFKQSSPSFPVTRYRSIGRSHESRYHTPMIIDRCDDRCLFLAVISVSPTIPKQLPAVVDAEVSDTGGSCLTYPASVTGASRTAIASRWTAAGTASHCECALLVLGSRELSVDVEMLQGNCRCFVGFDVAKGEEKRNIHCFGVVNL